MSTFAGAEAGGEIGAVGGPIGIAAGIVVGAVVGTALGYGAAKLGQAIHNANEKADEQLKTSDASEPCVECNEDPCAHLRKGTGQGKYHGGAHGETKGPKGDGLDSHHMPAAQANEAGGGPARDDGPAIQMEPEDHKDTMSNGSGEDAKLYRA
ncbi:hypothetical protein, partial [Acidocella sp. MX-AZ02]|uniref:hypothetical protein n=2 Tax=unclassified Acidocella TaxID=2648610 RepID=UPI00028E62BB